MNPVLLATALLPFAPSPAPRATPARPSPAPRATPARPGPAPGLWVNGRPVAATIATGRTGALLPLDAVAAALGARLFRDEPTGVSALAYRGRRATIVPGLRAGLLDGRAVTWDEPPVLQGAMTYISLQTVAEITGVRIIHDITRRRVTITSAH